MHFVLSLSLAIGRVHIQILALVHCAFSELLPDRQTETSLSLMMSRSLSPFALKHIGIKCN